MEDYSISEESASGSFMAGNRKLLSYWHFRGQPQKFYLKAKTFWMNTLSEESSERREESIQ